jgi:hypothetical protein
MVGDDPHDIGGHRLRFIPTPHVPHNWEAAVWFDETTGPGELAGRDLASIRVARPSTSRARLFR